jgi:hypothetical protein
MLDHFFSIISETVFGKNQRMGPVILFKDKGKIGVDERQQYSTGAHIIFKPKSVINGSSWDLYVKTWLEKMRESYSSIERERFSI